MIKASGTGWIHSPSSPFVYNISLLFLYAHPPNPLAYRLNYLNPSHTHTAMPDVILVTGGHGLVGNAIRHVLESEPSNTRYGRRDGETWIFASSREADLR